MRTFAKLAALAIVGSVLAACGQSGQGGTTPTLPQSVQSNPGAGGGTTVQSAQVGGTLADANGWRPIYTTITPSGVDNDTLDAQAAASMTIPFYTASVKSPLDGKTYTYHIAGANPHTSKVATDVSYVPIVARIHFSDGTISDPTKPGCGDTMSVSGRFFNGPNFVAVPITSNGIAVGPAQLGDAMQRAEFWTLVKGTGYHTVLKTVGTPIVVDVTAPKGFNQTVAGPVCKGKANRIGEIEINHFDPIVRSIVAAHSTTTQIPVFLSYNTVEYITTTSNCCVIGYHSAFGRTGGTQVYSIGAYMDPGIFGSGIQDIYPWSHEIGEALNDPFVNNATPAWGHTGQVTGCQNNLEVGDPLTAASPAIITKLGGFTYHSQELAFFDWFYRTPAEGTGAEYSFEGKFETAQGKCV